MIPDSDISMDQLLRYAQDVKRLMHEKDTAVRALEASHLQALNILARAAEFRDDDTGVHMQRLGELSERLALLMGCSQEVAGLIGAAAPMHDIGKIGIPDHVLKKPGVYTLEERALMNQHTLLGARIIGHSDVPVFVAAAEVALSHHECWDGTGYPHGLYSLQIPTSARIVAIVDFFDALTMDRVYRKAFPDEVACNMLSVERGRKFDPDMVDVFLSNISEIIALRDCINRRALQHSFAVDGFMHCA